MKKIANMKKISLLDKLLGGAIWHNYLMKFSNEGTVDDPEWVLQVHAIDPGGKMVAKFQRRCFWRQCFSHGNDGDYWIYEDGSVISWPYQESDTGAWVEQEHPSHEGDSFFEGMLRVLHIRANVAFEVFEENRYIDRFFKNK